MGKKKRRSGRSGHGGHYCKVCGTWKANERFSGKGHAQHICKECARLSAERRGELMTINRIYDLHLSLSKERLAWLDGMRADSRPTVREAAEMAYAIRVEQRRLDAMAGDAAWREDGEWPDDGPWPDEDIDLPF